MLRIEETAFTSYRHGFNMSFILHDPITTYVGMSEGLIATTM